MILRIEQINGMTQHEPRGRPDPARACLLVLSIGRDTPMTRGLRAEPCHRLAGGATVPQHLVLTQMFFVHKLWSVDHRFSPSHPQGCPQRGSLSPL